MPAQYNPKDLEQRIRKFWEERKIIEKLTKFDESKKKFYLLDGPPYVNAEAHVGHVKTTVLKDVWSKFKLMQGFSCWFQPGFDCHGLPIENMVERELGLKSKKDIEKIGVEKFLEACRKKAEGNEKIWLDMYKKIGAWRGYVKPYITLENYYIESGWWALKQMHEKGMLYEGEKPTFWCPHCQSSLAGYEVTDAYADVKDPYIYVKFPLDGKKNEYIVVATTTPWTLVSNVAIAVKGDATYVKVKVGDEHLIISEKRVEVLKDFGYEYTVEEKFLGKDLEGLKYKPVLDVPVQEKLKKGGNAHKIILSIPVLKSKSYKHGIIEKAEEMKEEFFDFVIPEEGSGAVHTAPGHGPEDFYVGQHYKLPTVSPVDDSGSFTEDAGKFKGIFVKDANEMIVEELRENGYLLNITWIVHSYPLCWRCKSPLVYRLTRQWFISIEGIKKKMLEDNEKVRWLPEFARDKFRNWLLEAVDWCISRQRYWGIPMPVWVCNKCGDKRVVSSSKELGVELPDLHKHVVDKVELKCQKCSGVMRRVPDILDVWFDSGIAPFASIGYPYKNKDIFEKLWPVDLVDESQDQIRGWFYSLMFCSTAIFGRAPYMTVAMNGWVLDKDGEKMSKSMGNVITAEEAIEKLGADVLRLYYCWEVAPWEVQKFNIKNAEELKKVLNIFWNCFTFYEMYGNKNLKPNFKELKLEDKWFLSKVNSLIVEVTNSLENFEFHRAGRKIIDFINNDMSRFYIKLIRDRVWVARSGNDKEVAISVLREALLTVSKLLAPISPFISEEIYQSIASKGESIMEAEWPKADEHKIDKELEEYVEIAKDLIEACLSARQQARIKLKWPVRSVVVVSDDEKVQKTVNVCKQMLEYMCNAKSISISSTAPEDFEKVEKDFGIVCIDKNLTEDILEEALIRELIREVQEARKRSKFNVNESIRLSISSDDEIESLIEKHFEEIKAEVGAKEIVLGTCSGNCKSSLKFRDKEIELAFDKL